MHIARRNIFVIGGVFTQQEKKYGIDLVFYFQGQKHFEHVERIPPQIENNQEPHPYIPDVELEKIFQDPAEISRKALVLVLKGTVNINCRDIIKLSLLIAQFIFLILKFFQKKSPEFIGPYIDHGFIEEIILKGQTFRGRKPFIMILYVWQVFLIPADQIKTGGKNITGHLSSKIRLEKAGNIIPAYHIDIEIINSLIEQQFIVLDKEFIPKSLFGIRELHALMTDEFFNFCSKLHLNTEDPHKYLPEGVAEPRRYLMGVN